MGEVHGVVLWYEADDGVGSDLAEFPPPALAELQHLIVLCVVKDVRGPRLRYTWTRLLEGRFIVDTFVKEFDAIGLAAGLEGPELEIGAELLHCKYRIREDVDIGFLEGVVVIAVAGVGCGKTSALVQSPGDVWNLYQQSRHV